MRRPVGSTDLQARPDAADAGTLVSLWVSYSLPAVFLPHLRPVIDASGVPPHA